jgi:hypothetical protein
LVGWYVPLLSPRENLLESLLWYYACNAWLVVVTRFYELEGKNRQREREREIT